MRLRLRSAKITHHGINDRFIAATKVVVPKTYRIKLHAVEVAAVAGLKELVPDVDEVLGTECYQILMSGYKLELEAIRSAAGSAQPLFICG